MVIPPEDAPTRDATSFGMTCEPRGRLTSSLPVSPTHASPPGALSVPSAKPGMNPLTREANGLSPPADDGLKSGVISELIADFSSVLIRLDSTSLRFLPSTIASPKAVDSADPTCAEALLILDRLSRALS